MPKSRMYQLFELRDNLKEAIENIDTLLKQQKGLVEIIEESRRAKEYFEFSQDLKKQWGNYNIQKNKLQKRLDQVNELIEMYKAKDANSELMDKIVTTLIEALGAGVQMDAMNAPKDE